MLLHGPPGTGKTSLARMCAHDAGVELFSVNGPEIVSQFHGESEKALHKIFESASQAAPAVVRFLHSKVFDFSFIIVPSIFIDVLLSCGGSINGYSGELGFLNKKASIYRTNEFYLDCSCKLFL